MYNLLEDFYKLKYHKTDSQHIFSSLFICQSVSAFLGPHTVVDISGMAIQTTRESFGITRMLSVKIDSMTTRQLYDDVIKLYSSTVYVTEPAACSPQNLTTS